MKCAKRWCFKPQVGSINYCAKHRDEISAPFGGVSGASLGNMLTILRLWTNQAVIITGTDLDHLMPAWLKRVTPAEVCDYGPFCLEHQYHQDQRITT